LADAPPSAQALFDAGNAHQAAGRLLEAVDSYRRAIELAPGVAATHNNLGNALMGLGRLGEAEASYRRSLELDPGLHEAHSNLGNVLNDLGRLPEGEASCRRALALRPDFAPAHNNLGNSLRGAGRLAEAEACYRRAIELTPQFASALGNLAITLQALGRLPEAEAAYRRVLQSGALDVRAFNSHSALLTRMVPQWHVPMMNDAERNEAYRAALRGAVRPETLVLEIGTGSGLLAMMAARAGAREVLTCEAEPLIAATAREIVAANGLARVVRVVAKRSTALAVGGDLPRRADVLVSEIFSSELLGEGVLASLEDAKRRLLVPGARIVPRAASVMCALFGGEEMRRNVRVDEVCGFDLRRFNAIAAPKRYLHRADLGLELLSADAEAFAFDFEAEDRFPAARTVLRMPATRAGRCYGVVQWLRLRMDERVTFENHPGARSAASGWQQCIYAFAQPLDLVPGQSAVVVAAHDRAGLWFFLERVEA